MKFNAIWVGWGTDKPTGIDTATALVRMTARPDTQLDMSRVTTMPLPDANAKLLNIGGIWEGGGENNWTAFFNSYDSGEGLKQIMKDGGYKGVVLDLETAQGTQPDIKLNELTSFISHCKDGGFYCFVTCMSSEAAGYVDSLKETRIDGVIPMLYNGSWTDLYETNWIKATEVQGAPLLAGIAYKYKQHYSFLNQYPSPGGIFVWGIGAGGGDATGEQCQELVDQYQ